MVADFKKITLIVHVPYLGSIHMRMYTYIHAVCLYMNIYIVYYTCKFIAFGA